MGSISDLEVMQSAKEILDQFGVANEMRILSAHRTPFEMLDFAKNAKSLGVTVIIAGAGGAAHLPGMLAAATSLPVIGVPVALKHLDGMDSLLSMVQMPKGVPVATVAINNSTNAALLALRILGVSNPKLSDQLEQYQVDLAESSRLSDKNLLKD